METGRLRSKTERKASPKSPWPGISENNAATRPNVSRPPAPIVDKIRTGSVPILKENQ